MRNYYATIDQDGAVTGATKTPGTIPETSKVLKITAEEFKVINSKKRVGDEWVDKPATLRPKIKTKDLSDSEKMNLILTKLGYEVE